MIREIKKWARSALMKRMMSWILWTPAPIQMLLVVAGMDVFTHSDEFILVINLVF